jgi:hypothetical protein
MSDKSPLRKDANASFKSYSLAAVAVHVLKGMSPKNERVIALCCHFARNGQPGEGDPAAKGFCMAACQMHHEDIIGIGRKYLTVKLQTVASEVYVRNRLIQIEKTAVVLRSSTSIKRQLKIGHRQIRSERLGPSQQMFLTELATFDVLSREHKIANMGKVLESRRINILIAGRSRPEGRFGKGDTLGWCSTKDHTSDTAVADWQSFHPPVRGFRKPEFSSSGSMAREAFRCTH